MLLFCSRRGLNGGKSSDNLYLLVSECNWKRGKKEMKSKENVVRDSCGWMWRG